MLPTCLLWVGLAAATPAEIDKLIRQLGDDDADRRGEAVKRLEAAGEPALAALREAAAKDGDADVRLRAAVVARAIAEALYGAEVRRFESSRSLVQGIALLPDGRALSGHDDGRLRVWDAKQDRAAMTLAGHAGRVLGVAASADGKRALSAGQDRTVRLWDLEAGTEVRQMTGHGDWVIHVAFSPDGRQALSRSGGHWDGWWKKGEDQTARLWDVATGKEVRRFSGHGDTNFHCGFLPGGRWAVTASADRTARVWEVATGKEVHRLGGHGDQVRCAVPRLTAAGW